MANNNESRTRIADFHQDRINPWLAEILGNPDFKYAEGRRNQLTPEGLSKVDIIFASLYRRANPEIIRAASGNGQSALESLKQEYGQIAKYYRDTKDFRIIKSPGDLKLEGSYQQNNVVLHLEGGDIITSPDVVDELYEWGVRSIGLMYNHDNQIGGGAGNKNDKTRGLTDLGKNIVDRVMQKGMIIDLAHANQKTAQDILHRVRDYNKTIVSHTAMRNPGMNKAVAPERLIDEVMLREISQRGGVTGFTPTNYFMPSMEAYIDQIKQAADSTGSTKNLAIASDFGGLDSENLFTELREIGQLGSIAEKLSEKGNFNDEQVADIMYGNVAHIVEELK